MILPATSDDCGWDNMVSDVGWVLEYVYNNDCGWSVDRKQGPIRECGVDHCLSGWVWCAESNCCYDSSWLDWDDE